MQVKDNHDLFNHYEVLLQRKTSKAMRMPYTF